ncbi:unnamed protein product [Auanema sp. JU1783]|nr:unnamed protein product [Auanema sp. JU1783]
MYTTDINTPPIIEAKDPTADKLAATIGFGVAATGIYDKIPEIQGCRSDEASVFPDVTYSEYVGERRINWREEFEETFANERNQYHRMRMDWESIGAHRRRLRAKVNKISKNKWIRDFLHLFLDGKIMKAWKRVRIVQRVLREREDDTSYRNIGNTAMLEMVIQTVVQMLIEPEEGFNLLMYLTTHSFPECVLNDKIEPAAPACFHRKHGDCMLAELILNSLPALPQRRLLAHSTISTRMRAIHFAACAGNPCQLDVLLKFNVNPNYIDATGRSPIQYAVVRNHSIIARQLMWHGADLTLFDSLRQLKYEPLPEQTRAFVFIAERYRALERAMCSWVKAFCGRKWKVITPVSSLHSTRLALYADSIESFSETKSSSKPSVRPRLISLSLRTECFDANLEKNADQLVLVFAIPLMFSPYDAAMPALYPHVLRTKLVIDNDYLGTPAQILSKDPMIRFHSSGREQTHDLPSIFQEVHNGFVYGWQIPKNIDRKTTPVLSLPLDPSQLSSTMEKHAILFVQAYSVVLPPPPKQKSE